MSNSSVFYSLYLHILYLKSCIFVCASISQVIGCEERFNLTKAVRKQTLLRCRGLHAVAVFNRSRLYMASNEFIAVSPKSALTQSGLWIFVPKQIPIKILHRLICVWLSSGPTESPHLVTAELANSNKKGLRLNKAASVAFELRTRPIDFHADGPATAKAKGRPYVLSRWRGIRAVDFARRNGKFGVEIWGV